MSSSTERQANATEQANKKCRSNMAVNVGDFTEGHELRNAGGKARFRLRCKHQKCATSMELVASQSWITNLIEEGNLCCSLVGLHPDEARVDPERPSTVIAHGEPSVAPPILLLSHSISPLPAPNVPQSDRPSALPTILGCRGCIFAEVEIG
ncbi:hypothetical protein J005_05274 [Cryptococcus neoformans]|nr:hypothetical protein C344_05142 [Cryptococcus neoformans var. grubii AD1-7a]OXH27012.1 hypothetical protein J005_05274 [Cryptococcus neoformans var. grubii]